MLGSGQFIPGFEEQLVGAKAGEDRMVNRDVSRPITGGHLAGKAAEFAVTVKAVAAPGEHAIDDDFAKGFGFDSPGEAARTIEERLERDYDKASRAKRSASCSTRSTSTMPLNCRKIWWSRNSRASGTRRWPSSARAAAL